MPSVESSIEFQQSEAEMKIIIARLEASVDEVFLISGNESSTISKKEMIRHIQNKDTVGKEYVRVQFKLIRAMRDGTFTKLMTPPAPAA